MRSEAVPSASSRLFRPARNRDKSGRMSGRPADPAPRDRIGRNQFEIVAARRDHDGPPERPAQQDRRDTVRIEIMRIDQVEIVPVTHLPPQHRQHCGEQRERRRLIPIFGSSG